MFEVGLKQEQENGRKQPEAAKLSQGFFFKKSSIDPFSVSGKDAIRKRKLIREMC